MNNHYNNSNMRATNKAQYDQLPANIEYHNAMIIHNSMIKLRFI